WTGLIVPEKFGGAGLSMLDMAVLVEEEGYAAMPGPFVFSSVLASSALSEFGSDELKTRWLPAIAEGKAIGTIAIVESGDSLNPGDIETRIQDRGGTITLDGRKLFVPYAHAADFVIVAGRFGDAPDDISFVFVERHAPG